MPQISSSGEQFLDEKVRADQIQSAVDRYQVLRHSALVLALIVLTITSAMVLAYWSGVSTH